jgi:monoamine oxidase
MPPEFGDALDQFEMGLLAKIPLQIPGIGHYIFGVKPYDNALQMFAQDRDIYFLAWPWDSDLMVGFVGGDFGWELSRAGQKEAVAFAKERLGSLFGTNAPRRVTNALLTPWATNRFSLGAYSAAKAGGFAAREKLRTLADKQIFFAGEAVGPCGMYATCSGAYMSGANIAWDVIAALTGKAPPDGSTYRDCVKVEPPKPEKKCPEVP